MTDRREPSHMHEPVTPDQTTSLPRLLTAREVADLVQRTRRTLLNWEAAGLLIPLRIGRSKYYRLNDIERLINGASDE